MNKQELIKKEWIEFLGKEKYFELQTLPDEDGWVSFEDVDDLDPSRLILLEDHRCGSKVRPKALNGIQTNNGWTKIECRADLPTAEGNYICGKIDQFGKFKELQNKLSKDMVVYNFAYKIITHYKLYNSEPPKY